MIDERARCRSNRRSERGHLMAGLMVLLALMLIFSTVIFQSWQDVLRRDNEAEMIFRAEEIVRAIVRHMKDRGKPPDKLEDLLEPGSKGQYFIRQLYADPLVQDGKWGLLYLGPGGQVLDPNAVATFTEEQLEALGVDKRAEAWKNLKTKKEGGNQPDFQPITDPAQGSEAAGGRQYAGLPIAGVKSLCTDQPFRVYKGQTEYTEWRFSYLEMQKPRVPGQPGGPGRGPGANRRGPGGSRGLGGGRRPGSDRRGRGGR